MDTEIIYISRNEEYGIESKVTVKGYWISDRWIDKFYVSLRDLDSNQIIDSVRIYTDRIKAVRYAASLTAGSH